MSVKFEAGKMYRMPVHFGPSLGPRQVSDAGELDYFNKPNTKSLALSFRSNPEQLAALLPQCYRLGSEPVVTITCSEMTNVDWLAGRGYSMIGVSFPAEYHGKNDQVKGDYLCVLFENMCEPIITGREELGYSKVYAEISDLDVSEESADISASWQGFTFLDISLSNLRAASEEEGGSMKSNIKSNNDGLLHYKYIPKTGEWGSADIEYPTLTPASSDQSRVLETLTGEASLSWNKAQWQDLPTLYNLVNTLADLEIKEFLGGRLTYTVGGKNLRKQRQLS